MARTVEERDFSPSTWTQNSLVIFNPYSTPRSLKKQKYVLPAIESGNRHRSLFFFLPNTLQPERLAFKLEITFYRGIDLLLYKGRRKPESFGEELHPKNVTPSTNAFASTYFQNAKERVTPSLRSVPKELDSVHTSAEGFICLPNTTKDRSTPSEFLLHIAKSISSWFHNGRRPRFLPITHAFLFSNAGSTRLSTQPSPLLKGEHPLWFLHPQFRTRWQRVEITSGSKQAGGKGKHGTVMSGERQIGSMRRAQAACPNVCRTRQHRGGGRQERRLREEMTRSKFGSFQFSSRWRLSARKSP